MNLLFSFDGRIGRGGFWTGALILIGLILVIGFVDRLIGAAGWLNFIGRLMLVISSLAVSAKRWHDRNKSGWWTLINVIPIIGPIWSFIELGLLPGTDGPNRFDRKAGVFQGA